MALRLLSGGSRLDLVLVTGLSYQDISMEFLPLATKDDVTKGHAESVILRKSLAVNILVGLLCSQMVREEGEEQKGRGNLCYI